MKVYWNSETRCAIATTGQYAIWCIVPAAVDPIYWCEEAFCLKTGIHTPFAMCQLIEIHPLTGMAPGSLPRTINFTPQQSHSSPKDPPPARDNHQAEPIPSVEKPPGGGPSFGKSKPYGGRY